ncbi:hypothetical protein [Vibrio splendidus]|uniref:hypothetical protein n=1 Tax=Vibrio splendidus TaxID=29497 RepID=UPI0000671318|nr:hypothetical protein [Vibrio splendidus]EAP93719.1 hypothetical protein V12B01_21726 [Vibrio splendidus 12B01]
MCKHFIDLDNYGGALPLRPQIRDLLCSEIIDSLQFAGLHNEDPSDTIQSDRQLELFDKKTYKLLLKLNFCNQYESVAPEAGQYLCITNIQSEVYKPRFQDCILGRTIAQLFKHFKNLMFVKIHDDIGLSKGLFDMRGCNSEYKTIWRPDSRPPVIDYISKDKEGDSLN